MPNCMGETNTYKTKHPQRDDEGHVILEPRNFTTKKTKTGKTDAVYFEKSSYVSVSDPFKKPVVQPSYNIHTTENCRPMDIDKSKSLHDARFKPAKHVREKYYKASFEHMTERVEVKKDFRDADGNVVTAPKNFYSNPPKEGETGKGTYFERFPQHVPDDYNYPKKVAREEMEAGKKLE